MINITITNGYESLVEMFIRNGLEFSAEDEVPTDLVRCWEARDDAQGGKLAGGCVLALREGEYIIDGIAVEPEFRGTQIGARLLEQAIEAVKNRGGKALYLVARAPGFFRKRGFAAVPREGAPTFFECFACPQYNKTCFPEVMRLVFFPPGA
ncbi:MAG: GNAT family N-acetyltransferase [Clostridiales Family XIII bacterium]|jgi:N-acetylglutamate synthase-like GNAT family acetyltransferase|nr:GNAT family N-acetyltransferase [Clostridiales Family XIII bacterium]